MRSILALIALTFSAAVPRSFAIPRGNPAEWTWEQIVADFVSKEATDAGDGSTDGQALARIDPEKAVQFFLGYLNKSQPEGMRLKAIGALGWAALPTAVPALIEIARNPDESLRLRAAALNPGLRTMKHPDAIRAAASLIADDDRGVRVAAYWVLGTSGTDEAVSLLEERLRKPDLPALADLIGALGYTKHPRAARIVFEHCPLSLLSDNSAADAYAHVMTAGGILDAQQTMMALLPTKEVRWSAFPYFVKFPHPAVAKYVLDSFSPDKNPPHLSAELRSYPLLWTFATLPGISAEERAQLRTLVLKINPYANFDSRKPADRHDETIKANPEIVEAILRSEFDRSAPDRKTKHPGFFVRLDGQEPSPKFLSHFKDFPVPVRSTSQTTTPWAVPCFYFRRPQWITGEQVWVEVDHGVAGSEFLVVETEGKWIVAKGGMTWVE